MRTIKAIWSRLRGRQKPRVVFEARISKLESGQWTFRHEWEGEKVDGQDVLVALLLHLHDVSEQTGRSGEQVLNDVSAIARSGEVAFYPAFEGLVPKED